MQNLHSFETNNHNTDISSLDNEKFLSGCLLALRQMFYIPFEALTTIRSNMEEYAGRRIKAIRVILFTCSLYTWILSDKYFIIGGTKFNCS